MARRPGRAASKRRRRSGKQRSPAAGGEPAVRVRHYCQGIGDCHLIRFAKPGGGSFSLLIDCGVHGAVAGGTEIMRSVVEDIASVTERIDVLVVTHEHWDHLSGFLRAAGAFAGISVGEVWMPWTENGEDALARELDDFRGAALSALQEFAKQLDHFDGLSGQMAGIRAGLEPLLGFEFGARGERVRAAREAAAALGAGDRPVYLEPGPAPITIPDLPNLRIFVMGPARDPSAFGLAAGLPGRLALPRAMAPGGQGGDPGAPFDQDVGTSLADAVSGQADAPVTEFVRRFYVGDAAAESDQVSWRRIDADWLASAADLAIRLDRGINNTSLVLAFELVDSGRVLLFPGDAEADCWRSWQGLSWAIDGGLVTTGDLLSRTIYLKVAHHGSRNGILGENGRDLLVSPDLAAFVPTSEADARKVGWGEMPFHPLISELRQRASGRLIRADDPWIGDADAPPGFAVPSGAIRALRRGRLWVELDLA